MDDTDKKTKGTDPLLEAFVMESPDPKGQNDDFRKLAHNQGKELEQSGTVGQWDPTGEPV